MKIFIGAELKSKIKLSRNFRDTSLSLSFLVYFFISSERNIGDGQLRKLRDEQRIFKASETARRSIIDTCSQLSLAITAIVSQGIQHDFAPLISRRLPIFSHL